MMVVDEIAKKVQINLAVCSSDVVGRVDSACGGAPVNQTPCKRDFVLLEPWREDRNLSVTHLFRDSLRV